MLTYSNCKERNYLSLLANVLSADGFPTVPENL